jgi:hypothetical protein
VGSVRTKRAAWSNCAAASERRFSGLKVSGSLRAAQMATMIPKSARNPKTPRQLTKSRRTWPTLGAAIGTIRNTKKIMDRTRAMVAPE